MKITKIAAIVAMAAASTSVSAMEVFNDGEKAVNIGGRLVLMAEANQTENAAGETESAVNQKDNSSRINFVFSRKLTNGWDSSAVLEYGLGGANLDGFGWFNRLGYVSFDHADYGQIGFGKQWSTYYDIAGKTDVFWVYGGISEGIYADHQVAGTGRANEALTYRNSFGGFNFGLQYQFEGTDGDRTRDYGAGISASYDFGDTGFSIGGAYNQAKIVEGSVSEDATSAALNATWANNGWYVSATGTQVKDQGSLNDATGYAGVVAYDLTDLFQVYGGFNYQTDELANGQDFTVVNHGYLGVKYDWKGVFLILEGKAGEQDELKDNALAAAIRYHF